MAQLDKIIKVMLDRTGSDIVLNTGSEPYLRVEGGSPHVLINRKLAAPHLKQLIGELIGEGAMTQLDATDTGEYTYAVRGTVVTVAIKSWKGSVEARIRPGAAKNAKATQTLVRAEVPKAAVVGGDPRRTTQNLSNAADAARGSGHQRKASDAFELDLSAGLGTRGKSPSQPSDLEVDISDPASSGPRSGHGGMEPPASAQMADNTLPGMGAPQPQQVRDTRVTTLTGVTAPQPSSASRSSSGQHDTRVTTASGEPAINTLLRMMVKQGGSDLHLSTGERPMMRKDGDMRRLDDQAVRLKGEDVMNMLRPILPPDNVAEFDGDHDTDFAYEIEGVSRFRGNAFMDRRGVGCVFRTIPSEIMTAEQLGLSQAVQALCYLQKGLVLVTGPTGSGKSTTLSTMIDIINRARHDHVITIEDPIEFVHQNKQCLINQRQVGSHTESFKRALRAALREDPDVVMVGEMRDLETMAIALETAETGHLVFGTLHTTTAYSTVDRLIDSFPADRQAQIRVMLSESLKGVVSQTLCKKVGGGRIAAYEVLLVNSAVSNLIREGKTFQIPSIIQTARKQGMVLLNDSLCELVEKKKIDSREAYIRSADKANIVTQLRAAGHKLEFLQGAQASA